MPLKQLADTLSVAPQIAVADIPVLAAQGIRSIINNRPDGEAEGQPGSASLAAAAEQLGIAYRHVPVIPGQLHDDDVEAFAQALACLPPPTLAFCRTGTRSTTLWALVAARTQSVDEVVRTAALAGYDLEPLRARLLQAAER